jgi:hypothetical protein
MCLDILARHLGSTPSWSITLMETLAEIVEFSTKVKTIITTTDLGIYLYIHIYIYMYVYMYIYMYVNRPSWR